MTIHVVNSETGRTYCGRRPKPRRPFPAGSKFCRSCTRLMRSAIVWVSWDRDGHELARSGDGATYAVGNVTQVWAPPVYTGGQSPNP